MKKGNWKRIGRMLAAVLLAGSLTIGASNVVAPVLRPQPVVAAATTHYPQGAFNYGDKRASIYVDPTHFTENQLAIVNQGVANVQTMLQGIVTITVAPTRSAADMVIDGKDLRNSAAWDGVQASGETYINYNRVVNHIAQHPTGTQIYLENSYRSYATSEYFSPQWSPRLPAQTDPSYQRYFDYYQTYFDRWANNGLLIDTEHEIGHGLSLDHMASSTYGHNIMELGGAKMDTMGNLIVDVTKDPVYIHAAQAIYGGQAIALGETEVKQPTQGYHSSSSGNSGNTGNTGNSGNGGNSGNTGNTGNSGNGTSTQNNTVKSARGNVFIGKSAGAEVYSDANFTNDTGKKLPFNTNWKGFGIVFDAAGNTVGFNLGGQQYIKFSDGGFAYYTDNKIRSISGVFTIHVPDHPTWGTAFYNDAMQAKGILRAGSKWWVYSYKFFGDAKQYYNLGGNQWIRADYGSLN